ncbi:MAG TPA: hypothetical protein ENI23_02415 [bacterium]|nr:hypothetical protein [bacterium]
MEGRISSKTKERVFAVISLGSLCICICGSAIPFLRLSTSQSGRNHELTLGFRSGPALVIKPDIYMPEEPGYSGHEGVGLGIGYENGQGIYTGHIRFGTDGIKTFQPAE